VQPHPFTIDVRCAPRPEVTAAYFDHLPERHASGAEGATPRLTTSVDGSASVLLGSRSGGAHLEIAVDGAVMHAWGVQGTWAPGRWPLLLAIHEAVRASGLLPLHCAAAVRPGDDGATAFLGPSGVGKSTTLVTLAQAGWAPVCEDYAWLDPASMRLHAWDHGLRLLPDALERLGPPFTLTTGEPSAEKRAVAYEELAERYGVERLASARLQRLAWLVRDGGPSRWDALPRVAAVPVLWEAIGLPLTEPARRLVADHIAELVSSLELRTLRLGTTPLSVVEAP